MKLTARKRCSSCGRRLSPNSFARDRSRLDGLSAICRRCKRGQNMSAAEERRLPRTLKRRGIRDPNIRPGNKGPARIGEYAGMLALIKDVLEIAG